MRAPHKMRGEEKFNCDSRDIADVAAACRISSSGIYRAEAARGGRGSARARAPGIDGARE